MTPQGHLLSNFKHGGTGTRIHECWKDMKKRAKGRDDCEIFNPWLDFSIFREWALSSGYTDDLILCRSGDVGNYQPDNVRWDTKTSNILESNTKSWTFMLPNGSMGSTENMTKYCRDNGLNMSSMSSIASGIKGYKSHKGYTNVRRV